jgi:hypothetical protein
VFDAAPRSGGISRQAGDSNNLAAMFVVGIVRLRLNGGLRCRPPASNTCEAHPLCLGVSVAVNLFR